MMVKKQAQQNKWKKIVLIKKTTVGTESLGTQGKNLY